MDMAMVKVIAIQPSRANLTVIFLKHEIEKGLRGVLIQPGTSKITDLIFKRLMLYLLLLL